VTTAALRKAGDGGVVHRVGLDVAPDAEERGSLCHQRRVHVAPVVLELGSGHRRQALQAENDFGHAVAPLENAGVTAPLCRRLSCQRKAGIAVFIVAPFTGST